MTHTTSKQPRTQRKCKIDAPLHARGKMVSSTLSEELRQKYKKRSLPVRKGDKVKIMRGEFKNTSGEISSVDTKDYKVYVTGVTIKKVNGTEVERAIDPSNVMITELVLEDKERRETLEKKVK
jgi:large subunit ribosomal protein L24